MLFASIVSLALAAISFAAPAPAPVELEERAVIGLDSISVGLGIVFSNYRTNPSYENRVALCRYTSRFDDSQRSSARRFGCDTNNIRCPTIYDQLNYIQGGLGQAYEAWTRNRNDRTVIIALCRITTRLTREQWGRINQLGVKINVQCVVDVRQQLNNIFDGLGPAYFDWFNNQNNIGFQQTLCRITARLTDVQWRAVRALNININIQCRAFTLRDQLNLLSPGYGDAWWNWNGDRNNRGFIRGLCALTAQLSVRQRNALLNLNVDVNAFGCRRRL